MDKSRKKAKFQKTDSQPSPFDKLRQVLRDSILKERGCVRNNGIAFAGALSTPGHFCQINER